MQDLQKIRDCYNKIAGPYATKFYHELQYKHLDALLLKAFAAENKQAGRLIDLGCGPGHTTAFMAECGIADVVGTDLSPSMIDAARNKNAAIDFRVADMLQTNYADNNFGSGIAFYAIVHFSYQQVEQAFKEVRRILKQQGQFLFSFHVGDDVVHLDDLLNHSFDIDFYFSKLNA